MERMAERTWEYLLPTGERLETRFDPSSSTESVYLGQRLVSRSTGPKPGGHVVELMHGDAAGPFRGGSKARVVFDAIGPKCEVTVDEHPLEPSEVPPVAQPKEKPPVDVEEIVVAPASPNRRWAVVTAVVLALLTVVFFIAKWDRDRAGREQPLTESARSPNKLIRVHYSRGIYITVRAPSLTVFEELVTPSDERVPPKDELHRQNTIVMRNTTLPGGAVVYAIPHVETTDPARLDDDLARGTDPWQVAGMSVVKAETHEDRCLGNKALVSIRTGKLEGLEWRVWSCTFLRGRRGYRLVTWVPTSEPLREQALRRILDATELL